MPGLRFFACDGCDTVYADVEEHRRCRHCEEASVDEIRPGVQAADYFS